MISHPVRSVRILVAVLAAAVTACASQPLQEAPVIPTDRGETTVYLVRHAEKATDDPADPHLSELGFVRADSLSSQLREAGVNVIITTSLRRTIETAAPLARRRRITPEVVPVGGASHVDSVVAAIRRHEGGTILVVGHSNTIGRIAERLGGGRVGDLCDSEYSNLIILNMPRGKPTRMLVESYGPPDAGSKTSCVPLSKRDIE